jgi:site-specific recombinase XerD
MTTTPGEAEASRFASFLQHLRRRGRKDATLESYSDAHAAFWRFLAASDSSCREVSDISGIDLRSWKSAMLKALRAPTTINHRLTFVRQYATWAAGRGDLTSEQLEAILSVPLVESPALAAITLPLENQRRFLRRVESTSSRRDRAIVFLLLNGLRIGEVAGLQVADVRLSLTRGAVELRGEHIKRSAHRIVPLMPRTRHALRAHIDEAQPVAHVFIGQRGPLTVSGIDKIVRGLGDDVGLEVHAHLLRHQFSQEYLEQNPGDLIGLQKLLGHTSIETTSRHYARLRLTDLEQRVARIEA